MIQKSEMITQAEMDWLAKLAKSAGNGGYVLDYLGAPCFDGDRVLMVDSTEAPDPVFATLSYDKELRRWWVVYEGDTYHKKGEYDTLFDMRFLKNETEEKRAGA